MAKREIPANLKKFLKNIGSQREIAKQESEERTARRSVVFSELSPSEKLLVQVMAVNYQAANRTAMGNCLNRLARVRNQGETTVGKIALEPVLSSLLDKGVIYEDGKRFRLKPDLFEPVVRELIDTGQFEEVVEIVVKLIPLDKKLYDQQRYRERNEACREVRIAFYRGDHQAAERIVEEFNLYSRNYRAWEEEQLTIDKVVGEILGKLTDPEGLRYGSELLMLRTLLDCLIEQPLMPPETAATIQALLVAETEKRTKRADTESEAARNQHLLYAVFWELTMQRLLSGRWQKALAGIDVWEECLGQTVGSILLRALPPLFSGEPGRALELFEAAFQQHCKIVGRRKTIFEGIPGVLHILAALGSGEADGLRAAAAIFARIPKTMEPAAEFYLLQQLLSFLQGQKIEPLPLFEPLATLTPFDLFVHLLVAFWTEQLDLRNQPLKKKLLKLHQQSRDAGYLWFASELDELLARVWEEPGFGEEAAAFRRESGAVSLFDLVSKKEAWSRALEAIDQLADQGGVPDESPTGGDRRLVWQLTISRGWPQLQPREQRRGKNGVWSGGRNVALKNLHSGEYSAFSPHDQRICSRIKAQRVGYYGAINYYFPLEAMAELVGHPLVFRADDPTVAIEVAAAKPELLVERKGKGLLLRLSPQPPKSESILVAEDGPGRVLVYSFTDQQRRLAEIIGGRGLRMPESAAGQVMTIAGRLTGLVTIHSDLDSSLTAARKIEADSRPVLLLHPQGEGLRVHLVVRPLGENGPHYPPGGGRSTVLAAIDGESLSAGRDLELELKRAKELVKDCPTFAELAEQVADWEWLLLSLEASLDFLHDLRHYPAEELVCAWPEGKALKVLPRLKPDAFSFKISTAGDWFALEGECALDEERLLDLRTLLDLLAQNPGRFITLGEHEFLTLSEDMRKRLDELRAYSQAHGKGRRFRPLAAQALGDLLEQSGKLKADKGWRRQQELLTEARGFLPTVPSTLQAELRDYQIEGYAWLARLAKLGAGACLADDMGLGKTVQALALLLQRAAVGPALVIAPTSVCPNWQDEAARFAPSLRVLSLGQNRRQETLAELGPLDLLVVSYGLLQTETAAKLLAEVEWGTVILDEAQAIKNFQTRRSQAAMRLNAGFRCVTTGTPVENHLGELWNIFNFINPGLLGSQQDFKRSFILPIEQNQDVGARRRLKKLVLPFILRRNKAQVLEELPPRTEIVLTVEPTPEDAALHETIRRRAVEVLQDNEGEAAGSRHLKVLAELMRLRRAACHPRLVLGEGPLMAGKLPLFAEVLHDIISNRHKALVFSQFVDHLSIVREYLDSQQIIYQYLDGSTPARERKRAVAAFQAGEGDLFCISLKAGGTGLNLTAADYVIHLDPWWNPAVEDQASDRAHRIGQLRPVTIYRLVTKGSIEEKILALHGRKRDLAENLLSGSDTVGRVSTDDLIRLLQGNEQEGS